MDARNEGDTMNLSDLKKPFAADDIEWRIQQSGLKDGKPWGMCLAYVTNRAIMDRLDNVVGPENWRNEYGHAPNGGVLCGISIRIDGEWITKYDGADNTDIESVKGGLSNAMKRAAVQWGIGRYLYNLETGWATFAKNGKYTAKIDKQWFKWNPPNLPEWALPDGEEQPEPEIEEMTEADANLDILIEELGTFDTYSAAKSYLTDPLNIARFKKLLGEDSPQMDKCRRYSVNYLTSLKEAA